MAIKLADVFVNITGDSKGLDREFARVKKSAGAFGNVLQGVLQGVGQAAFRSMTRGLGAVISEMGRAVNAASDLEESINKVGVVFGESAQEVLDWSKTSATAMGQSQHAALEAAGTFGNLFTSMGVGRDQAADLSTELVQLASDLASFNNVSPEEALIALRSGIVGEIEPLRRFGVSLSAAAVESKALEMGLAATSKELTEQDKILARYELILQQTANAQGDFARTSDGLANQQRIFAANMQNAAATIGQAFAPVATTVFRQLNKLITQLQPYGEGIINALADGLARGIVAITPVLVRLRQLFTYWLKPGSPPRLLPELDKWGQGAMNAYLAGWTNADLSIFDELASSLETVIRSFAGSGAIKETDLVSRVFGTRDAITRAITEFQRAGSVSASTLRAIERAAGPAGGAVTGLVRAYFDLQSASRAAAQAQEELTAVTERYDDALAPINEKLRAVQNQQADIRDQQRAAELNAEIADINTSASDRRLAQLELEEIELRRQQRLLEEERDTAVGAAEDKLEAAREEERARQDAYNRQQAVIDQQVEANRLIEEEAALRQRLADEALAAQERALRDLEAAQKELERAENERKQELERIYQAQLAYNMQIADTPGKIALLKQELGRYTEGSAEYYDILTQIAALEQQLARERESGAGGGLAGMFGGLEEVAGEGGVLGTTLEGVTSLTEALDAMFEALEAPPEAPTGYWADLTGALKEFTTALTGFATFFGVTLDGVEEKADKSSADITELQKNRQAQWLAYIRLFTAAAEKDWSGMWAQIKEIWRLGGEENRLVLDKSLSDTNVTLGERLAEMSETFGGWLAERAQAIGDWGETLRTAAGEAIKQFFRGIREKWEELEQSEWVQRLKSFRDYLPFSEPRNPNSPLRGLGDSGAAILENMMRGMEQARISVTPQMATALAGPAAGQVVNNYFAFDQVFSQAPDWGLTRAASRDGVLAALRTRGA